MRTLIFGAGAIGGYLGGLLADAGADVTLLARSAQLSALANHGIKLEWADGRSKQIRVKTAAPGQAGSGYDLVIVTLKSMQLAGKAWSALKNVGVGSFEGSTLAQESIACMSCDVAGSV